MANGNEFRSAKFINSADLFRALPNRPPVTQAKQNVNSMMTGGGAHSSPLKPIQAGAGAVKCASCGSFHRPGTICSNTVKAFDRLMELVKASSAGKEPSVTRVPVKGKSGGNPYHSPDSGQFTSKEGGGSSGGAKTAPARKVAAPSNAAPPDIGTDKTAPAPSAAPDSNSTAPLKMQSPASNSPNDQATGAYKSPQAESTPQSERPPANANEVHEKAYAGAVAGGMPKDKALIEGTKAADSYDRAQGGGKGPQTRMMDYVNKPQSNPSNTPTLPPKNSPSTPSNTPTLPPRASVAPSNVAPPTDPNATPPPASGVPAGPVGAGPGGLLTNSQWMQQNNGGVGLHGTYTGPPPGSPPSSPGNGLLPGPTPVTPPPGAPPSAKPGAAPGGPQAKPQKPFTGNRMGQQQDLANTLISGFKSGPSIGDPFSQGAVFRPTINVPGAGLHTLLKPQPGQAQKSLNHLNKLTKWRQGH